MSPSSSLNEILKLCDIATSVRQAAPRRLRPLSVPRVLDQPIRASAPGAFPVREQRLAGAGSPRDDRFERLDEARLVGARRREPPQALARDGDQLAGQPQD